jgi:hypothetical protein
MTKTALGNQLFDCLFFGWKVAAGGIAHRVRAYRGEVGVGLQANILRGLEIPSPKASWWLKCCHEI